MFKKICIFILLSLPLAAQTVQYPNVHVTSGLTIGQPTSGNLGAGKVNSAGGYYLNGSPAGLNFTCPAPLNCGSAFVGLNGTQAFSWASGAANLFFGTPSGGAGAPALRSIVPQDLPSASAHNVSVPLQCSDSSGSTTAEVCSTAPTFTPVAKDCLIYTTTAGNSSSSLTLAVNGGTALPVLRRLSLTLLPGDVPANKPVPMCSDGSHWLLENAGNPEAYQSSPTVGMDGLWTNGVRGMYWGAAADTSTPTSGTMYAQQLIVDAPLTLGHATAYVTTAGSAETLVACVYNSTGTGTPNVLVWSGNVAVNTATATASISATQTTLIPGIYWFAFEQSGTTAAVFLAYPGNSQSAGFAAILNAHAMRWATAANTVSGTTCPASLGTLTAATSPNDIMVLLEP